MLLRTFSAAWLELLIEKLKIAFEVYPSPSVQITALDINWLLGNVFYKDISVNSTFTFSNTREGDRVTVIIKNTSGTDKTVTFPTGNYRAANVDFVVQPNKENIYIFVKSNSKLYLESAATMATI